jgi:hypothetical protein
VALISTAAGAAEEFWFVGEIEMHRLVRRYIVEFLRSVEVSDICEIVALIRRLRDGFN